jgi:hypothetical protein
MGKATLVTAATHTQARIHVPLDRVLLPLTRKALKSMTGIDFCPNFVVEFLFRGIVATIGIQKTDYLIAGAFDAFGEPSGVVEDFV